MKVSRKATLLCCVIKLANSKGYSSNFLVRTVRFYPLAFQVSSILIFSNGERIKMDGWPVFSSLLLLLKRVNSLVICAFGKLSFQHSYSPFSLKMRVVKKSSPAPVNVLLARQWENVTSANARFLRVVKLFFLSLRQLSNNDFVVKRDRNFLQCPCHILPRADL